MAPRCCRAVTGTAATGGGRYERRRRRARPGLPAAELQRDGFTLVEVLLAVLLGGILVGVSGVVAVQSVAIRRASQADVQSRWARIRVFQQFQRDIDAALWRIRTASEVIEFPQQQQHDHVMHVVCLTDVPEMHALTRRRMPSKVSYLLEPDAQQHGRKELVREVRDLTRARENPIRHVLADGLVDAGVEVRTKAGWLPATSLPLAETETSSAIRLYCQWEQQTERQTRTIVLPIGRDGGREIR